MTRRLAGAVADETVLDVSGTPRAQGAVLCPTSSTRSEKRTSGALPDFGAIQLEELLIDVIIHAGAAIEPPNPAGATRVKVAGFGVETA